MELPIPFSVYIMLINANDHIWEGFKTIREASRRFKDFEHFLDWLATDQPLG
jgi:uncharacterized protein with GYD domain